MSFLNMLAGVPILVILGTATIQAIAPSAEQRVLTLETLQYNDDDTVSQRLSGGIPADWTARVTRLSNGITQVLCSGQGEAAGIYDGEQTTYSTDEWTGDDCPTLQSGDIGKASWTYKNEHGFTVTTLGQFVVR